MESQYQVAFGNRSVGTVQVYRQGLYYRFVCRCKLTGKIMCRLRAVCGNNQADLGIVVPTEDGFGLDTKLPVKKLGEGSLSFQLVPNHTGAVGNYVPIYPEEPFGYISRLKDLFLERQNGTVGVRI